MPAANNTAARTVGHSTTASIASHGSPISLLASTTKDTTKAATPSENMTKESIVALHMLRRNLRRNRIESSTSERGGDGGPGESSGKNIFVQIKGLREKKNPLVVWFSHLWFLNTQRFRNEGLQLPLLERGMLSDGFTCLASRLTAVICACLAYTLCDHVYAKTSRLSGATIRTTTKTAAPTRPRG